MKQAGQAMRHRFRLPGFLRPLGLGLVVLHPAATFARADDTLIGTWDIEVHEGIPAGDYGTITIRRDGDRLVGDLTYTDTRADITASEFCQVWVGTPTITIWCEVLAPKLDDYWPDNFAMRRVSHDRMEGQVLSITSGAATMTRGEVPTS